MSDVFSVTIVCFLKNVIYIIHYMTFCELDSFTHINAFEIYPSCLYSSFSFYCLEIHHGMDVQSSVYSCMCYRTFVLFLVFDNYEYFCYKYLCSLGVGAHIFYFFRINTQEWDCGSLF